MVRGGLELLRLQGAKPDGYEAVRTTWMARFDEKEEGKEDHWARCLADGLNTLYDRPAALDQKQLYLGIALAKASTSLVEPTQDSLDLIILLTPTSGMGDLQPIHSAGSTRPTDQGLLGQHAADESCDRKRSQD